jgi:hypothetical protein
LVPNTILLGDSQQSDRRHDYCQMLAMLHRAKRSIAILRDDPDRGFGRRAQIDVWWGGLQANGGLMLLLAYLLRTSGGWRGANIDLKLVVPDETAATAARPNLEAIVQQLRLGAVARVIVSHGRPFPEILHESSQNADLVFLGMAQPSENFTSYYERLQEMATGLPTTMFVLAAPDFAFDEVLQQDSPGATS